MKQPRNKLARNLTWLFLAMIAKKYGGFETREGTILVNLKGGSYTIKYEGKKLLLRHLQTDDIQTFDIPSKTGVKYKDVREFVPSVFRKIASRLELEDIQRFCRNFHPSRFYVIKYEKSYLESPFTATWSKRKGDAMVVPFELRHDFVLVCQKGGIDIQKCQWQGVSGGKNKFAGMPENL
jgi:hypothetical protein